MGQWSSNAYQLHVWTLVQYILEVAGRLLNWYVSLHCMFFCYTWKVPRDPAAVVRGPGFPVMSPLCYVLSLLSPEVPLQWCGTHGWVAGIASYESVFTV